MNRFFLRFTEASIRRGRFALVFAAAVTAFTTVTAFGQSALRCESMDGQRQECRFNGPGTVQLWQQLGLNACVKGKSWGVDGNTVWVDHGCRADFKLIADDTRDQASRLGSDDRRQQQGMDGDNQPRRNRTITIVCESRDGRRHRCAADTLGQITLGRQLTADNKCVEGRTWGSDSSGIWVDRGCRAEFSIADNGGTSRDRGPSQAMKMLVCESHGSTRTYCRADAQFGVRLMREMSRDNCVVNETWGADRKGVWVSNGCRAEFAVKTRL